MLLVAITATAWPNDLGQRLRIDATRKVKIVHLAPITCNSEHSNHASRDFVPLLTAKTQLCGDEIDVVPAHNETANLDKEA